MNKNIVFIGLSGSGKTTIGKAVAKKLHLPFYDIDEYIEKKENRSIKAIFNDGENFFRLLETKAIEELSQNFPCVISTGGGAVKSEYNMKILSINSIIFFINRPIENIIKDIDISNRPLLKNGKEALYSLYKERYELYKAYCDIELINNGNIEEAVHQTIELIKRN